MSMASHPQRREIVGGINSSEDALKSGPNQNCRVFSIKENKYVIVSPQRFQLPTMKLQNIVAGHPQYTRVARHR